MPQKKTTQKSPWEVSKQETTLPRSQVIARTQGQQVFLEAMQEKDLVFCEGPAGTGKTYLAVAVAVKKMLNNQVSRIILTRPAVEAGENLGFLPGTLKEKIDPYLRPLYDALYEMLTPEVANRKIENGDIEVAPLAYMRGRTLKHAAIILDEAQNTTPMQMKMFLTRLGEGSSMVVNGDLTQTDLPKGIKSGLIDAMETVAHVNGVQIVRLTNTDVVRCDLVQRITQAYEERKEST